MDCQVLIKINCRTEQKSLEPAQTRRRACWTWELVVPRLSRWPRTTNPSAVSKAFSSTVLLCSSLALGTRRSNTGICASNNPLPHCSARSVSTPCLSRIPYSSLAPPTGGSTLSTWVSPTSFTSRCRVLSSGRLGSFPASPTPQVLPWVVSRAGVLFNTSRKKILGTSQFYTRTPYPCVFPY